MVQNRGPALEAVTDFYDNTQAVEIFCGENVHLGYWPDDEPDLSMDDAQDRLTDLIAQASAATSGRRVLDVGCGTGGPACRIARTKGAYVTGVTISPKQVDTANSHSRQQGLSDLTNFRVADATSLPFGGESFDAAIAIESILHMPDKTRVLHELFRVLRPGAKLAIADITQRESETIQSIGAAVSILDLLSLDSITNYRQLVAGAGFHVDDVRDISEQTRPSYREFSKRVSDRRSALIEVAGTEQTAALEDLFTLFEKAAGEGKARYVLLAAHKPDTTR
ncbi:SAM-dependent methyltransferase [Nocardia brasiliensis]|uniref:SAM-dependent methyltransferase n=1 Tax=Nocardia brasiliensis TaxID=37326 RepID=UPI00068F001C|nr:methyltransferase domain-containing protein [Nocardia brasiliensis]